MPVGLWIRETLVERLLMAYFVSDEERKLKSTPDHPCRCLARQPGGDTRRNFDERLLYVTVV